MKRRFETEYWMSKDVYGHSAESLDVIENIGANSHKTHNKIYLNAARNMSRISEFCNADDIQLNDTVIVVGAGPSARDALGELLDIATNRKDISIILSDRIFEEAAKRGVRGDLIFSSDPSAACGIKMLRYVDNRDSVMCDVLSNPTMTVSRMLRKAGKTYLAAGLTPFSKMYCDLYASLPKEMFRYRVNYLVTFNAVDFAYWSGAEKIITIGNDLCWRSEESFKAYVAGTKFNDVFFKIKINNPDALPARMLGVDYYSTWTFFNAAAAFKWIADTHKDCEFVDCSFGLIDWKRQELAEAIN